MFWDEAERRWKHHPDCRCHADPCRCAWLRPLDRDGEPMPASWIEEPSEDGEAFRGGEAAAWEREQMAAWQRLK